MNANQPLGNVSIPYIKEIQSLEAQLENQQKYFGLQEKKRKIKIQNLKIQIEKMQKTIQKFEELNESQKNDYDQVKDPRKFISQSFIVEVSNNLKQPINRRRYTDDFYDFAMLLYLQSPKTYRTLRQIFPFPCEKCLMDKYSATISQISRSLVDFKYSFYLLKELDISGECTLAIDAFCFRSFSGTSLGLNYTQKAGTTNTTVKTEEEEEEEFENNSVQSFEIDTEIIDDSQCVNKEGVYSNGFIFMLIPLSSSLQPKIIHIEVSENGSYNEHIDRIAEYFKESLRRMNITPLFHATDGDRGMSEAHDNFFATFFMKKNTIIHTNFETLISNAYITLSNQRCSIPVSDPLHLFKNFRGKLIDYKIQLFPESGLIDCIEINNALHIGMALEDKSSLSRMRDSYVLQLFSFSNFIQLIQNGLGNAAFIFFGYSCIITSIFSNDITFSMRMSLLETAYEIFFDLMCNVIELKSRGVRERGGDGIDTITFAELHYAKRILNTIVALGVAIRFGPPDLRMDAIGSHLVENSIGLARSSSYDPRWQRILRSFTNSELRKQLALKLGITLHIQKRINAGGCKIKKDDDSMIDTPKWWNSYNIFQILKSLCIPGFESSHLDELEVLINEIKVIATRTSIKTVNSSEIAGSLIIARLFKFKCNNNNEDDEQ